MTNGKCCRVEKRGGVVFYIDTIHDYILLLRPKLWCWRGNIFFSPPLQSPYFPFHLWILWGPSKVFGAVRRDGVKGDGRRDGGLVERWIKREATEEAERKLVDTVLILPPVGQLGSIQVQSGAGKTKPSPANHLHLERLSAPVTHPVSVTNSNKHPNLITQLPLHPTASKEKL